MVRRVVLVLSLALGVAAACTQFSSGDSAVQDGGADSASADGGDAAPDASGPRFFCPAPANSCAFGSETCCYDVDDAGSWRGSCAPSGTGCATQFRSQCAASNECRAFYDSSAAACCDLSSTESSCSDHACDYDTLCNPDDIHADCPPGKTCQRYNSGFGRCK